MNWNAVIRQLDKDHKRLIDEAADAIRTCGSPGLVRDKMLLSELLCHLSSALSAGLHEPVIKASL